jgi:hypothetical protein
MLITLRAAFGQDEVSHGAVRYRVGADRLLFVPPSTAGHLVSKAGFCVVRSSEASHARHLQSQFLVGVRHPTAGSCSYGGARYRADEKGNFLVPAGAVADLVAHGFVPIPPDESAEACRATAVAALPPVRQQHETLLHGPGAHDQPRGTA